MHTGSRWTPFCRPRIVRTMWFASGHTDITPAGQLPLAGFSARSGESARVASRLEANAVVLQTEAQTVALVSMDLLYVGCEVRRRVLDRLRGRLAPEGLFLAASHTHFAPSTCRELPLLGEASPAYVQLVSDRVADLLLALITSAPEQATIGYHGERARHAVNRRRRRVPAAGRFGSQRMLMLPNVRGPADEAVDGFVLRDAQGRVRCVLWGYACHPVAFPDLQAISADYPGVVRDRLRAVNGDELAVLFFQGFSGDTRPRALGNRRAPWLRSALNMHAWRRFTQAEWDGWAVSLSAVVELAVAAAAGAEPIAEVLSARRVEEGLAWAFDGGHGPAGTFAVHQVELGPQHRMVGVTAEVVTAYGRRLRDLTPSRITMPIGCLDETFGYLPTDAMVQERGYEVDGFRPAFGITGAFRPGLEGDFMARLAALSDA